MCRRRGLKASEDKNKIMMLNGEEGLECEVCKDGMQLDHVSKFKYLGCALNESGTDDAVCHRKVAGDIKSLVIAR